MTTLIITILNERKTLESWFASLAGQSKLPDELVVVDGGSTDGTWELLQQLQIEGVQCVFAQKQGNISTGRNEAIRLAQGEVIIVTDAGCIYDRDWFRKLSDTFAAGAEAAATGFGPWLEAGDSQRWFLLAAATTPRAEEFAKDWLPSSRTFAFKKSVWQAVGGYPEWIPICEDIIYDLKIKKQGFQFEYVREPLVFWRPRPSYAAYAKQLFRYTKSDGHGKLWFNRQLIRYAVYFLSLALLFLSFARPWLLLLLLFGVVVYVRKFWLRYWSFSVKKPWTFRITGLLLMPFVVAFGDAAKMCGWPLGVYERLTGKIKFENY